MKGLWQLQTRTVDSGLGAVIFEAFMALAITSLTCLSIVHRSKHWQEAWILHVGLVLLSTWFVLHWIDLLVHNCQTSVNYNYILFDAFNRTFRAFSDVFVLWGVWRVMMRYQYLRLTTGAPRSLFLIANCMACLLWALAVYHICLLFAVSFTWLSFSDLHVINAIAKARSGFEVAFTALQFFLTCLTALVACVNKYDRTDGDLYYKEIAFMMHVSLALLLRSFCEVVIVGQLDRNPAHLQTILPARDITYGIFSSYSVICLAFAVPITRGDDPLVTKDDDAVQEVKSLVTQKLQEMTEHGTKTAPTISELLDSVEVKLKSHQNSDGDLEDQKMKLMEVGRLKGLYADWEPVYKWQGGNSEGRTTQFSSASRGSSPFIKLRQTIKGKGRVAR